jgi:hypothetical protein
MRNRAFKHLFIIIALLSVLTVVFVQTLPAGGCGRRDSKPPKIHYVLRYPLEPEYEDAVLVLAYITDSKSGVANATLCYTVDGQQTVRVVMDRNGNLFTAEIPPLPYNSTAAYVICAYDKAGNKACSEEYVYTVGDFHPPTITFIQQVPAQPNYNDTVVIFANAVEPLNASGVKELILSYGDGSHWTSVGMHFNGTLYCAAIPEFSYGTVAQYKLCAVDNAGNAAALDVYSYRVEDRYLPVAAILTPKNGSFIAKSVNITVYAYDDNFLEARLAIDDSVLASWNQTGTHTCMLDTPMLSDGVHKLLLEASDEARNKAVHTVFITVDNKAPKAEILSPTNGDYVKGTVLVRLHAEDENFERMELKIGEALYAWEIKNQIYVWNTTDYGDGEYEIILTAMDKAGNKAEERITVKVDNTAPTISELLWTPKEPEANETVKASVQLADEGSGIREAALWFRVLGGEWQKTLMTLENGNWTATIPGFKENAIVTFYVECGDNVGNVAKSVEEYYAVKAAAAEGFGGIPLYWLILAVVAIFAVLALTAYYVRKKRRGAAAPTFIAVSSL